MVSGKGRFILGLVLSLLSTYSMRLLSFVILSDGLYALRVNR